MKDDWIIAIFFIACGIVMTVVPILIFHWAFGELVITHTTKIVICTRNANNSGPINDSKWHVFCDPKEGWHKVAVLHPTPHHPVEDKGVLGEISPAGPPPPGAIGYDAPIHIFNQTTGQEQIAFPPCYPHPNTGNKECGLFEVITTDDKKIIPLGADFDPINIANYTGSPKTITLTFDNGTSITEKIQ